MTRSVAQSEAEFPKSGRPHQEFPNEDQVLAVFPRGITSFARPLLPDRDPMMTIAPGSLGIANTLERKQKWDQDHAAFSDSRRRQTAIAPPPAITPTGDENHLRPRLSSVCDYSIIHFHRSGWTEGKAGDAGRHR